MVEWNGIKQRNDRGPVSDLISMVSHAHIIHGSSLNCIASHVNDILVIIVWGDMHKKESLVLFMNMGVGYIHISTVATCEHTGHGWSKRLVRLFLLVVLLPSGDNCIKNCMKQLLRLAQAYYTSP